MHGKTSASCWIKAHTKAPTRRRAADFLRDPVGTLLDAVGGFGVNRGAFDKPLHDGVQVCQDLQVQPEGSVLAMLIPVMSLERGAVKDTTQ